jgi:hypothetical protein
MEAARSGLETRPERAIEALAGGLGLGGSELAALGASARTIERGRTGRTTRSTLRGRAWPSSSPWRRISKKLGDPDARRAWLRSGNPYLGG